MKKSTLLYIGAIMIISCNNRPSSENPGSAVPVTPEKAMQEAISLYPDSLLLKENLIQYYRENNQYDLAIATADAAIKRMGTQSRLWDIKATLQFENEDTLGAIASFEKAVALDPDPQYLMSLGVLYAETKNPKAINTADALLSGNKGKADKEALFIKGLYFNYSGEKQKAIILFDQCLASDYNFMDAYREKAVALYDLEKYHDALNILEKATTLQNGFDEGYYWMGKCYEKLKRDQDAIESYRAAVLAAQKNNDDNIDAREALERLGVK